MKLLIDIVKRPRKYDGILGFPFRFDAATTLLNYWDELPLAAKRAVSDVLITSGKYEGPPIKTTNMSAIPRRAFIQCNDIDRTFTSSQHKVEHIFDMMKVPVKPSVFDVVVTNPFADLQWAFEQISASDEIFFNDRFQYKKDDGLFNAAGLLMNTLMKKAVAEKLAGKSLHFLTSYDAVQWSDIHLSLLRRLFTKQNKLFFVNKRNAVFEQVNLHALLIYIQFKK